MITFSPPTDENPYGVLNASIEPIDISKYSYPLTFEIKHSINGKIKWSVSDMYIGHWCKYVEPCNSIAHIKDANNNIIESWVWDTMQHGDLSHTHFLNWSLNNKGSKGIAIGTHDGTTGEWVVPVKDGIIDAVLVEASDKQFDELSNNYDNTNNSHLIKSLITTDGKDCIFFECPEGYTNSINKEHIIKYTDNFVSVNKQSLSLNDLIVQCGLEKDLKWLHLDVEGIDDELIMSLDDKIINLPELIIYESLNLTDIRKKKVIEWLENKSYVCKQSGWNTIATLTKPDISLLVHTCDDYLRFWPGMLFSLDFNWNFNVPVYWASEEISIHNHNFTCRELPYKPNNQIKQILTGKTDKNGFSTRMINALNQIDSKWVIYIQEDMWLLSKLDSNLISKLLLFSETMNVDSIKIHTKLAYYDAYKLENTNYFIDDIRVQKYSSGDNFLHSHNATIWNKEYLLKYLVDGEDPWTNEIEGSKRMSINPHNHYHYNIHWYSQPGVCEKGEFGRDFYTLAPIFDDRMEYKLTYDF